MTDEERDALRSLQDELLAQPPVVAFIDAVGASYPLWEGGPTAANQRKFVYPEWRARIETLVEMYRRGERP